MPTELSISGAFAKVVHALATKSFDLIFPPKYFPPLSSYLPPPCSLSCYGKRINLSSNSQDLN
jgi:hypothetical protein